VKLKITTAALASIKIISKLVQLTLLVAKKMVGWLELLKQIYNYFQYQI